MIRSLLVATLCVVPLLAEAQTVPEPDGYRMDHYRDAVPGSLRGARVIGPEEAYEIWRIGEAAFIDVLPQPPKPANLPEGTIWRDKPRTSIPGAIWLPNVGYGAIAQVTADYFRAGLEQVTQDDPTRPIVIFCLEDCWMSWNAAKRAIEWGYSDVSWMPEGTDGWHLWDYPMARITPADGQPQTQ